MDFNIKTNEINIPQPQVQLAKALLMVAGSPFYASLYRAGLKYPKFTFYIISTLAPTALEIGFPGLCRCVSVLCFIFGGALATYSRFTMTDSEEESDQDKETCPPK